MERLKAGLMFWVILLVAVLLPASAQTQVKKVLYQAKIKITNPDGSTPGVGSSLIQPKAGSGYEIRVMTHAWPHPNSVTKVSLVGDGYFWELIVCEDGGVEDCLKGADGNLDIETTITAQTLNLQGVPPADFNDALRDGKLIIKLENGTKGTGTYIQIFP